MKSVYFYAEAELSVDEKYKKTLEEIEALKDHLGMTVQKPFANFFYILNSLFS